jgi:malate synthase
MKSRITYYEDFLSPPLKEEILKDATTFHDLDGLLQLGRGGGLETKEAMEFLIQLYKEVEGELNQVLNRRTRDRKFIDERTRVLSEFNQEWKRDFHSSDYQTLLGQEDADGRVVMGPRTPDYHKSNGKMIAPIPEFLQGHHITLFGPPDSPKLCVNAMNAYHRKLKGNPLIVQELLHAHDSLPKWGADDEDSKTPLRQDLVSAGENLTSCLNGELTFEENGKKYQLEKEKLSLPIKRFPGIALPCFFLFYKRQPIPLHLYDFALHFYHHWRNPKALAFYVPKLENEEEARYIRHMIKAAERILREKFSSYQLGSVRLMIVLENPRAIFRINEIIDELYPYFAGASLGWHDFLASTARVFKEDPQYRIPVKADPDIVIKYIKASHDILADVVGARGGIKVGGMYGILPIGQDLASQSFQLTLKGYIRDVITQLKRHLTGFWVAHPDFVPLGLALTEAWKIYQAGDRSKLDSLVTSLLEAEYHEEILNFIYGPDVKGLDKEDPLYPRSLIVADLKESDVISNNHPDEIRYNVFQTLQYLTDWLSGNGCVALPAQINGISVRVMDDLATAERSRWEVWHEIYHGRFRLEEFIKIAYEELTFIRKDLSHEKKMVQVKWDERTAKWYPVALKLMLKLMTDKSPVEFATQLLLPFTVDKIRSSDDPWSAVNSIDPDKFRLEPIVARMDYYFELCGSLKFIEKLKTSLAIDLDAIQQAIMSFDSNDIAEAAFFHGDIGESKKTLDRLAIGEQQMALNDHEKIRQELRDLAQSYLKKFGIKFLISAKNKTANQLLTSLKERIHHSLSEELHHAREALWEITLKRLQDQPLNSLREDFQKSFNNHSIESAQVAIISEHGIQQLRLGNAQDNTWFEMCSLSKSVGSAFAMEYFRKKNISLDTSVDELLAQTSSDFRLHHPDVTLTHLMNHSALNLHYVNGAPLSTQMPDVREFLTGNKDLNYPPIQVINPPGEKFQYSGGGFLVLEHLIQEHSGRPIQELTREFLDQLGMEDFSFIQTNLVGKNYACGFSDDGKMIQAGRKMFPAFAAGAMGSARGMAQFLCHLERAYHHLGGSGPISHDTAIKMLYGSDKGSLKFMGARMGLGIFIAEAGPNKFALHQGANDGFRCIFLHCFQGPDRGKGLVVVCNSDFKGVLFNAEVTQSILREFNCHGIDPQKFRTTFNAQNMASQEVVNLGYKNLILNAFMPMRAEAIENKGPIDPLASFNILSQARVLEVSNDLFARGENLISDYLPQFDPELFGQQGKIMDSWETVRHNLMGEDYLILELKSAASVRFVQLSTKFHTGNFAPEVKILGLAQDWEEIIPKIHLAGHSLRRIRLEEETKKFSQIKVIIYPDGGLTRLGLYSDLPQEVANDFFTLKQSQNIPYLEKVPATKKSLGITYAPDEGEIKKNWSISKNLNLINFASSALGAKILKASNEHYAPANLLLSPYLPLNMFDGLESARNRIPGHYEEVSIQLARESILERIEIDFTYFVNNNPQKIMIEGQDHDQHWITLVPLTEVKAYAGNKISFSLKEKHMIKNLRVTAHPCGGMNRLRAWGR